VTLDPGAEAMLKFVAEAGLDTGPDLPIAERRARMHALTTNPRIKKHPVHSVEDHNIPTATTHLPVRVYRPSDSADLPMLVWFHGGGWTTGDLDTHDQLCRQLCDAVGCVVMAVDYRLAPEEKFPGAANDCFGAYDWATRHAGEVGADPTNLAVGGDSAGGNLAAVVAILAREKQAQPPKLQVLVYPVVDHEFESPSMIDNAKGFFLETENMRWFFDQYARTPDDFNDRRLSPMRAKSLANLPRAVVVSAEYDPLRDQDEAYGRRLQADGVATEIVRADGLIHGFFGLHAFMPPAQEPWDVTVNALRQAFGIQ
jgi:acetyl esterase